MAHAVSYTHLDVYKRQVYSLYIVYLLYFTSADMSHILFIPSEIKTEGNPTKNSTKCWSFH